MSLHPLAMVPIAMAAAALSACSGEAGGTQATGTVSEAVTRIQQVPRSAKPYTLFETLQVRPLALSPDRKLLYAANTPDNRLEVFRVQGRSLLPVGSTAVGLEPVAVAVRSNGEVWVVNHLSDSVSIVRVDSGGIPEVVNTLLVGDEPRDIVFAGPRQSRAFITTAHRGQSSPDDPDLFNPAAGRADVWVFDANDPGTAGGRRVTKITLFADTPRALAASADGKTVYAAAFLSGDQTTTVSEDAVDQVYGGVMPGPAAIDLGGQIIPQPTTGLIVKWKLGPDGNFHWIDPYGTLFDPFVRVTLPDQDVFAIDATASPPVAIASGEYAHVGTTLFNMAVNPRSGKVYVSNTDAHNDVRFEGHTPGFTSVAGNTVDSRITVIDPAANTVTTNNLNSHLDHAAGTGDPALSLAFPEEMAVSHDGKRLYVVAQGSAKLAIYDTAALEAGTATPSRSNQIVLRAGGPTGLAVDEPAGLAFVLTRFDDGISVVDLGEKREVGHLRMFSPEPASVTEGRRFLYDATLTSTLGDQACASCHIGGDLDGLAWDLGNPGNIPLAITTLAASDSVIHAISQPDIASLIGPLQAAYVFDDYQPLKGPMTTQSLRGLDNQGAMHWRGDRNGAIQQTGVPFLDGSGAAVVSAQPNSGIFDEVNAFVSFNVAFPGLVGSAAEISDTDMSAFAAFMLQATYPPNPIRALDDSLTPPEAQGAAFFVNSAGGQELPVDRFHNCNGCHVLDRNGNAGQTPHPGFFGTDGRLSFENETQTFKVPHLRNAYQKVGMFGSSLDSVHGLGSLIPQLNPQTVAVRGFGFQHDGTAGTLEDFFTAFVFIQTTVNSIGTDLPPNPDGIPLFANSSDPFNPAYGLSLEGLALRQALAAYLFAFDTNLYPIVGQQITLTEENAPTVAVRITLLETQAALGQTDLVAHGTCFGRAQGFTFSGGVWFADVSSLPPLSDTQLRSLATLGPLTFTAVPPGEGWRAGIDRDGDGYANGDEIAAGTDPADWTKHP